MKLRALTLASLPLSLALVLGACSSSSDSIASDTTKSSDPTTKSVAADTSASETVAADAAAADTIAADAVFNAGDVTFVQGMIPHHQQAVEMATIALDQARNAGAKVKDLATRIQSAQDPEIERMTGWLKEWGQPVDGMGGMSTEGKGMAGMDGMMTSEEMTGLEAATGPAFDKLWLEMMIRHHQGAVAMSKTIETDGKAAVVKELAGKIISAQETEIAEMQQLLAA